MKSCFNHHCVLKLNLGILMPVILIPNCQLISSNTHAGLLFTHLDCSRSSLCSFRAKYSSMNLAMGLETHPQIIILLSSSSFLSKVSLLLLFDVSAQALFREFLGIHLAFLFRCLGMITGYQHHPFINPSTPVPSWREKIRSKYTMELLWVNLITQLLIWTCLQKLLTALKISMPTLQLGHFFVAPWFSQISRWPFIPPDTLKDLSFEHRRMTALVSVSLMPLLIRRFNPVFSLYNPDLFPPARSLSCH